MTKVHVKHPGGEIVVKQGLTLLEALKAAGVALPSPCGGRGKCGKCRVKVVSGKASPCTLDTEKISPGDVAKGYRLACQFRVTGDVEIAYDHRSGFGTTLFVSKGGTPGPFGLALDLGTTTIGGSLIDLSLQETVGEGSLPNPQWAYGGDLMTRLAFALEDPRKRDAMQSSALGALKELFHSLTDACGVDPHKVTGAVLVANSPMHHLALGYDVSRLSVAPYLPETTDAVEVSFPGLPPVYAAPLGGGFVGSDALAAALSVGLNERGVKLLIDLGTNTEVILSCKGGVSLCSAPAGPAFEGAEITCGMPFAPGAVRGVRYQGGELLVDVVGEGTPQGVCGSGLLDALAVFLGTGLVDPSGRMAQPEDPSLARMIEVGSDGTPRITLGPGVYVTQRDVRALQLAKGAVRAAVDVLLSQAGLLPEDLDEVFLTGAFGSQIRRESALALGLLPQVSPDRISAVSNGALLGASMLVMSGARRRALEGAARNVRHVSLYDVPGFENMFLSSLEFGRRKGEGDAGVQNL